MFVYVCVHFCVCVLTVSVNFPPAVSCAPLVSLRVVPSQNALWEKLTQLCGYTAHGSDDRDGETLPSLTQNTEGEGQGEGQ